MNSPNLTNGAVSAPSVVAWCSQCQVALPDDALFCPSCGRRGEFLKQPYSGSQIGGQDKAPQAAHGMSTPVSTREVPTPASKPAPSSGNKILAYVIFGFIWLAIVAIKAIGRSVAQRGSPVDVLDLLLVLALLWGIVSVIQQICVKSGRQ